MFKMRLEHSMKDRISISQRRYGMKSGGKINMGQSADMGISMACANVLRICRTRAKCAY